jgi:hypothetical protein
MNRIAVLWLLSLLVVGGLASILTAQSQQPILSGSDVGFRVERMGTSGQPVGTLMVRVNGKWVEAGWATQAMPAK